MADNKNPLFIAPKFDWTKPNLYDQFKIFSRKVKFAFDGQFKDAVIYENATQPAA